jgi:DNA-binding PucR family transcriptional regulator
VAAGWRSRRQADLAARAVPLLDRGDVAHWGALGVLQLLARIPTEEMDDTVVPDAVGALQAADPHGRLVETLTEYLHSGGAGSATADALHIHRTTLYYRLDRIRRITGLDIDDGDVRLHLQLGLLAERMRRRLGAAPPHP